MFVNAFIQNKKGSRFRSFFNEKTLEFIKKKELLAPAPYQYGFIPGTLSEDGDCLDIWLISETDFKVGTIVECRVLGLLEMTEEYQNEIEIDHKILACPSSENIIITEEITVNIKNYTFEIFKIFPKVKISFGSLLSTSEAEKIIQNSNPGFGD